MYFMLQVDHIKSVQATVISCISLVYLITSIGIVLSTYSMSHPHVFRYREYGPWPCSVRSVVSPYSGCSVHANLCQDPD